MTTIEIDPSRNPAAVHAANRSRLYALLAQGFCFPSADFHRSLRDGLYRKGICLLAEGLPYPLPIAAEGLVSSGGYVELQSEYIRLFEVGPKSRPPYPLYEGERRSGARMRIMEELVRFYEHFGLSLSTEERELPDHLAVELEFLHYLTFKEAAALAGRLDPGSYRKAEIDFLDRHPAPYLSAMRAKIVDGHAEPPFEALTCVADDFLRADLAFLRSLARPGM